MPTGTLGQEKMFRNMVMELDGLATEEGTGTTSSKAVTINDHFGVITTEALTTEQDAVETFTLTNSKIKAGDMVFVSVANGTNTQGTPMLGLVTPANGSCAIKVINKHASDQALNGTLLISFMVVNAL